MEIMSIEKWNKDIKKRIHFFTNYGAAFKAYATAIKNYNVRIDRDKVIVLLNDCAKKCLEVRNSLLDTVGEEEPKYDK